MQLARALPYFLIPAVMLMSMGCGTTAKLKRTTASVSPSDQKDTLSTKIPGSDTLQALLTDEKKVYDRVSGNTIPYHTFSAKLKIDFANDKGTQEEIIAFVHLYKDSAIWITVTPLLGIEVARVMITPDSVKIMDKLHRTITSRGTGYMQGLLNVPLNFSNLQNIIIGNPVFLSQTLEDFTRSASLVSFTCRDSALKSRFDVFADDYRLQQSMISETDTVSHRYCDITFADYINADGRNFSSKRKIFAVDTSVTQITLNFNRVKFDVPVELPFYVPSDYRRQ